MGKNLTGRATKKQGELLNFYGVVKDNKSLDVEYAIVMVFACFIGGIEKPLEYTFTDNEGRYFISIPKHADNHDLLGFKVRASKPHIINKAFGYPINCKKESYKENKSVELIDLNKAGESEYYRPFPEGVVWVELKQPIALDTSLIEPNQGPAEKVENAYKNNEFASTAFFLLVLSLFGIFAVDVKSIFPGR